MRVSDPFDHACTPVFVLFPTPAKIAVQFEHVVKFVEIGLKRKLLVEFKDPVRFQLFLGFFKQLFAKRSMKIVLAFFMSSLVIPIIAHTP